MTRASDTVGEDTASKPFLEHLEDLRHTLMRCLGVFTVGLFIALPLAPFMLGILQYPLYRVVEDPADLLISTEVTGALSVILQIAFWGGLLFSAPFLLFFIGSFIFPGLRRRERVLIVRAGTLAVLLFIVGVGMGYFITLPVALELMFRLHDVIGTQMTPRITDYVAFTMHLLIAFGLAFEMPVIILVLGRFGILRHEQLRQKRRHVFVGLLILAMLLTPPDVITQLIMATPLFVLYEGCIWVLWSRERKDP